MKPFITVVLAGWLIATVQFAKPDACVCGGEDGRALCIDEDAGAEVIAALRLPVTLELRSAHRISALRPFQLSHVHSNVETAPESSAKVRERA
jgi:hypothetical protein